MNVRRSANAPVINNLPTTININETLASGSSVFRVDARDDDGVAPFNILRYSITGDDNAPQYFTIDAKGNVSVQNRLSDAPGDEVLYRVSL